MKLDDVDNFRKEIASRTSLISTVIPLLNESDNIPLMYAALTDLVATSTSLDWEFIFVDDGSTDRSYSILCGLSDADPRVKIIQLSRNYGSHAAASAGLRFAGGDAAVIMAADLQDHPRELTRLIAKWQEGYDVVWGVRLTRDDPFSSRIFSKAFAWAIRRVAIPNYPTNGAGSFCLVSRKVIDAVNSFPERNRSIGALILFSGFRQAQISYDRGQRTIGRSRYTFTKKLKLAADIIIAFSVLPLRAASLVGLVIAALAFCFGVYEIISRLTSSANVPGFATLATLISFLGGLHLTVLGILGEYLWRTLDDVRGRPLYLIQQTRGDFGEQSRAVGSRADKLNFANRQVQ